MMKFLENNKVIVDSMSRDEASAFVKFLKSEMLRHQFDIEQARALIFQVVNKFKLGDLLDGD